MKRNITLFYILAVISGFTLFYNSIDTLYYRHFNLSFSQIGLMYSLGMLAGLIFEIPTGIFADLFGKKKSLVIAGLFSICSTGLLLISSESFAFYLSFIFGGIAGAFNSGAKQALLFDSIEKDKDTTFAKITGRSEAAFVSIDILSGFAAPLLFAINVRLPFGIAFAASVLTFLVILLLKEPTVETVKLENEEKILRAGFRHFKESLNIILRKKIYIWFVLFNVYVLVSGKVFAEMISAPYFAEVFKIEELSIIFSISAILQTIFLIYADKISKKLGINTSLLLGITIISMALMCIVYSTSILIVTLVIGIYYGFSSLVEVVTELFGNLLIEDNSKRATILSILAMLVSIIALAILPVIGYLIDLVDNNKNSIILLAIISLALGYVLLVIKKLISFKNINKI